jgi:hypothetical protein
MKYLLGILLLLVIASIFFLKIAKSFGGVNALLAKDLKLDRKELSGARKKAKQLKKAASKEMEAAGALVSQQRTAFENRVDKITAEYESWANPKAGASLIRLGNVVLTEHALIVGNQTLPLDGLSVDSRITDMSAILIVSLPNGMKISESFDTAWRDGETKYSTKSHNDYNIVESTTERKRAFSPDQIIHLCGEINNQIIRHADFVTRRPEMIELLAIKVKEETADTRELDLAINAFQTLESTSVIAQESKLAVEALAVAEEKYSKIVQAKFGL